MFVRVRFSGERSCRAFAFDHCWAYMLGREVQSHMPRGASCRLWAIKVVFGGVNPAVEDHSGIWKDVLNRPCNAGVASDASEMVTAHILSVDGGTAGG